MKGTPALTKLPTVTVTKPVVAPCGTAVTKRVGLAEKTAATVPLNFTVFKPGVELKPFPEIVTSRLIGPEFGLSCEIMGAAAPMLIVVDALPPAWLTVNVVVPVRAANEIVSVAVSEFGEVLTLLTAIPGLSVFNAEPERLLPVSARGMAVPAFAVFGVTEVI